MTRSVISTSEFRKFRAKRWPVLLRELVRQGCTCNRDTIGRIILRNEWAAEIARRRLSGLSESSESSETSLLNFGPNTSTWPLITTSFEEP